MTEIIVSANKKKDCKKGTKFIIPILPKMDNHKENEEPIEIEEQFILRLPKEEAKIVHKTLQLKPKKIKKILSIQLRENMRQGTVCVKNRLLKAKILNLPTIVESYKTYNRSTICKTADIAQMLDCTYIDTEYENLSDTDCPIENEEDVFKGAIPKLREKYKYPHGLTPPLRNVKKRRFRKPIQNKNVICNEPETEKELLYLLKADLEAVSTRYEIIYEDIKADLNDAKTIERNIFGDISDSSISGTPSTLTAASSQVSSTSDVTHDLVVYNN